MVRVYSLQKDIMKETQTTMGLSSYLSILLILSKDDATEKLCKNVKRDGKQFKR